MRPPRGEGEAGMALAWGFMRTVVEKLGLMESGAERGNERWEGGLTGGFGVRC